MPENETRNEHLNIEELRRIITGQDIEAADTENPRYFSPHTWVGIAQDRARNAIELGLSSSYPGHHIAVVGLAGSISAPEALKKHVSNFVNHRNNSEDEESLPEPRDLCCVYNFEQKNEPLTLLLPRGGARRVEKAIEKVLERLKKGIPDILRSDAFEAKAQQINAENMQKFEEMSESLLQEAEEDGRIIIELVFNPRYGYKVWGRRSAWVDEEQEDAEASEDSSDERISIDEMKDKYPEKFADFLVLTLEFKEKAQKIVEELTEYIIERQEEFEDFTRDELVSPFIDRVFERVYSSDRESSSSGKLIEFLKQLKAYSLENFEAFMQDDSQQGHPQLTNGNAQQADPFLPFRVNVLIDNSKNEDPPIIIENNPSYENLMGGIDVTGNANGMIYTDHTMVRPGTLAQANGGYLILNLKDVVMKPGAYQALMSSLKNGMLEIEDMRTFAGYPALASMPKPTPIPLKLKVIMTGSSWIWRLLSHHDNDLYNVFGVKAELSPYVKTDISELSEFAAWVDSYTDYAGLSAVFSNNAVAKMVEFGLRMSDNKQKLPTDFEEFKELMHEAAYAAQRRGSDEVSADDVQLAVKEKFFRSDLIRELMMESIEDGTYIYDFEGERVGEGYGLVVYVLPEIKFGKPARLSARTYVSPKLELVSADEKAELAGKMTVKAHATIAGFLRGKFPRLPLRFGSSFAFEEMYGVDGPSASLIEALIRFSSLAEVPIRQDIAMTGSMDQHGKAQVIGGVNQKVEGMFNALKLTGSFKDNLSKSHGVVIPRQNVKNLMLNEEVIDAAESGEFAVWSVDNLDQVVEIFTGMPAGEPNEDGSYPEDTFWGRVEEKIKEYNRLAQEIYRAEN